VVQLEKDTADFQGALAWALPTRLELKAVVSAWIIEKKLAGVLSTALQTEMLQRNIPICQVTPLPGLNQAPHR
jgi:hypothetical protein